MTFFTTRSLSKLPNRGRSPGNARRRRQQAQRPEVVAAAVGVAPAVRAWAAADALDGPLVVAALGFVVAAIPDAVTDGMTSAAGRRLIAALIIAALLYTASLVLDP